MSKQAITILKEEHHVTISVQEKCTLPDIQAAFEVLGGNEVLAISVAMPASAASDFMLVQLLAYLRKLNKTITLSWTDHKPVAYLARLVNSVIHK